MARWLAVWAVALLAWGCGRRGTEVVPEAAPDAAQPAQPAPPAPLLPPPPSPVELAEKPSSPFALRPLQTSLETWELTIPQSALDQFAADPWAPEQPATFTMDGWSWPVTVRLRGSSTRSLPKRGWKVDFGAAEFQGRKKLNLVAEYVDASLMAEKLGYDLLSALHVPAPRATYVRLVINGRFEGVYLEIEQIDKRFVSAHGFADRTASVYRCGNMDCEMKGWKLPYQGNWEKKTNETETDDHLDQLLRLFNRAPEPQLAQALSQQLDLERYLLSRTMEALIGNNLVEDSQSFFIEDRVTGKWIYVPWDLNNSDSSYWPGYSLGAAPPTNHPLFGFSVVDTAILNTYAKRVAYIPDYLPVFSNLNTRLAFNPDLSERFLRLLERALNEVYRPEVLNPRIDAIHSLLKADAAADPYTDYAKFEDGRRFMRQFVANRASFLRAAISKWRSRSLGLVLEELDPNQGTVVLRNRGSAPASLSGLVVTTDLRRVGLGNLPVQILAPGETASFAAADLGITLGPEGELGLFDGQSVLGAFDVLFYGLQPAGKRYARAQGSSGAWEIR